MDALLVLALLPPLLGAVPLPPIPDEAPPVNEGVPVRDASAEEDDADGVGVDEDVEGVDDFDDFFLLFDEVVEDSMSFLSSFAFS